MDKKQHKKLINNLKRIAGAINLLKDEIDKLYEDLVDNGKEDK